MQVDWNHVKRHRRFDVPRPSVADARLVVGTGEGSALRAKGADVSLAIALSGEVEVRVDHAVFSLERRQHIVIEAEHAFEVVGNGIWLVVLAGRRAWKRCSTRSEGSRVGPVLLPAIQQTDVSVMTDAVEACRAVIRMDAVSIEAAFGSIARGMGECDSSLRDVVARCPGRSWEQRRNAYVRLHRARAAMESSVSKGLDVGFFAELANYSLFHFIRAFKMVYGTTPYAFLMELRMRRARQLLRCSRYAIYEIAYMSGFEDRCAFARSFRKHFGESASAVRRRECDERRQAVA